MFGVSCLVNTLSRNKMKVCIIGNGPIAEKNIQLFSGRHTVSLYVTSSITEEESIELAVPIIYDPTLLFNIDLFVVCVEVKYNFVKHEIDLEPLLNVSQIIRQFAQSGSTVIIESKVGVGVTRKLFAGLNVHCSYSPAQFNPDDTVTNIATKCTKLVGGIDQESEIISMQFYNTIYSNVVKTGSPEVAEGALMLKSAQEMIQEAIINEFSDFCDTIGLDVHEVIDATSAGHRDDPTIKLPWIGRLYDSKLLMMNSGPKWPIMSVANEQLIHRPLKIYKSIVDRYCAGNYDMLHKLSFLVVGLGTVVGSSDTKDSPVLDIIRYLEMEGAVVSKYDMFVETYCNLPELTYNSGKCKFDGILVMHPYMVSTWDDPKFKKQTTFFCRH